MRTSWPPHDRVRRLRGRVRGELWQERRRLLRLARPGRGGDDDRILGLFDTGSDRIRPESTPTLKEIGEMLRQHASLRLRIEGHTDNVGQAAANQTLSERRAAAVRQHLVSSYGIDASRLEAVGKGQTEPAASNDTLEGRQNNRRVVLVRL